MKYGEFPLDNFGDFIAFNAHAVRCESEACDCFEIKKMCVTTNAACIDFGKELKAETEFRKILKESGMEE